MSGQRISGVVAGALAIVLACVAAWLSIGVASRAWMHSSGGLHIWYHLGLFGVLGALGVRASDTWAGRIAWVGFALLAGFGIELLEARGFLERVEWGDVQMNCCGVGLGCFAAWLFSGKSKVR